eukprot:tig00000492_g1537.t1
MATKRVQTSTLAAKTVATDRVAAVRGTFDAGVATGSLLLTGDRGSISCRFSPMMVALLGTEPHLECAPLRVTRQVVTPHASFAGLLHPDHAAVEDGQLRLLGRGVYKLTVYGLAGPEDPLAPAPPAVFFVSGPAAPVEIAAPPAGAPGRAPRLVIEVHYLYGADGEPEDRA